MKHHPNIILVGFMGSGKTTIAKIISNVLKLRFIDLDSWIEKNNKSSVPIIFATKGEAYFRTEEEKAIKWLSRKDKYVVSIGGGAWISEINRKRFLHMGWCVWLKVTASEVWRRIRNEYKNRPLLAKSKNPLQKINNLMKKRENFYRLAHFTCDTTSRTPEEIATLIVGKYEKLIIHSKSKSVRS